MIRTKKKADSSVKPFKEKINSKPNCIIVIGASAGGFEALSELCEALPSDLNSTVLIVWHTSEDSSGFLAEHLNKKSSLPVSNAVDGKKLQKGHIYIAPPDRHLLIDDSKTKVVYGPKENRFRPAIDPLFRSAAFTHNENVIGIILTGVLDDGTAGLWAIKDRGGIAIVQNPDDALFSDMPKNAIKNVKVDYVVSLKELPDLLVKLTSENIFKKKRMKKSSQMEIEINMAMDKAIKENDIKKLGTVSEFTCPECNGSLWKMEKSSISRFRCRTGHAFTAEVLLQALSNSVEDKLWSTIRGLEETASLIKYIAETSNGDKNLLKKYMASASLSVHLRKILMDELGKEKKL